MSAFAVNLLSLSEIIDRLAAFQLSVESEVGELDARAARVRGAWSGAAADAYTDAHREWVRGASELRDALAQLRRLASTAHGNYSSALQANLAMWP